MSVSRFRTFHGGRRRAALIAGALGASLLAVPASARAQTAPTIVGSLANFDVVNDTEGEKEGFEIQLEGLEPADITRVFGQTGGTCYIRYCLGTITPYGTVGVAPFGVYVRWTATFDQATQTFTTPAGAPGGGHGTPSRVGNSTPLPVTGEACWSLGAGAAYPVSGCEHFGVSTTPGRFPTATKTVTYRWLVPDPAAPGTLVAASPAIVPPVPISHPVVQAAVVAGAPDVLVAAPAAPPVALDHRYGKAEWVKVYKTEIDRDADLDELVGGHPNNIVPNGENHLGATETEWKLLQFDVRNPDKGGSVLASHGTPGGGSRAVVRRYEFYKYTGAVVPPGGTSGGGKGGGPVLSTDDQEASLVCTRVVPGDVTTECIAPGPGEVGDFIGAQMAAQNLGNLITPLISWPAPGSIAYGTALGGAQLNATATANGSPVAGAFSYTPPPGSVLDAGTRTLQVTFTPDDPATFGSQTMTMLISVDKAPLTVIANHQSKVYGSPDPLLTFAASGFQAGDTVATALSGSLAVEIGSGVGPHAITAGTLATTGNYTLAFTGNTLDITPASLTIAAAGGAKVYGTPFTPAGFTATGLQNGDTVASVTLTSAGSPAAAAVGSYDIVPSAAAGTGLANYSISYANGTLKVTPAALAVVADAQTKVEGTIDPPLTFVATGLEAGDSAAAVLVGALTRVPGEAPGSYAIGQGTLAANANYAMAFTGSTLVITAAPPPPPPPPPTGGAISIAPIPPQTNNDGDEVELQVNVVRSAAAPSVPASPRTTSRRFDDDDREARGAFTVSGLNGLTINREGEIKGRIDAEVTTVTVFNVIVTFTGKDGTATQQIVWTVKPAPARRLRRE
jgi:MBG domain-containing protein